MNAINSITPTVQMRFSILHLLFMTMGIAIFCVILMNENDWLRATYFTVIAWIMLAELVASISARGERQAFALGFTVSFVFLYFSIYIFEYFLPYLITQKLYAFLEASSVSVPSDDHFYLVMGGFWYLSAAFAAGLMGRRWHRHVHQTQSLPLDSSAVQGTASLEEGVNA